jgi:osmoprotectant transport system ATP-binding protein
MTAAFRVSEAVKTYAGARALGPVDLTLEAGTTTLLLGPSGSGKSTLLRLLNGLLQPDAGTVLFDGEAPTLASRLRIGYVIQGGGLFPHLTAEDNVALVARWIGWEADRVSRRMAELSELVRLPPQALRRFPRQLSGGQAQRVGLMRALMLDPPALLLDEPLGALDPVTRFDLQQDLRDAFARLRKTVVLVTHDLAEASFFGGTAVLMRDGRLVQRGPFSDLLDAPADEFVARFVQAHRIEAR